MKPLLDRLMDRVSPEPNTGCWLWEATLAWHGYAVFTLKNDGPGHRQLKHYVHRLMYELLIGPIPEGLQLDHKCRTRCCVNPAHLEPVTLKENLRRGRGPTGRWRNTHCINGHELTGDNVATRGRSSGGRRCRVCHRERMRQFARRKSAA